MALIPRVQQHLFARPSRLFSAADSTPSRAARPAGLLGAVVLIVLVETAIVRTGLDTPTPATMSWRQSGEVARKGADGAEVLVFGDSLIKHGLRTRIFEERTGLRTYNLSVCASQIPADYALLRQAIGSGARPRYLIFEAAPDLMSGKPTANARNWPELLTVPQAVGLCWTARDADLFGRVTLALALPSYRARADIRKRVIAPSGFDLNSASEARRLAAHWAEERGANVAPDDQPFSGAVDDAGQRSLMSHGFWCDRINRGYLDAFLRLAGEKNLPIVWVLPPVSPAVQGRRDATGADEKMEAFVRSVARTHPHVIVLDARRIGFENRDFVDPRHLSGAASARLTEAIAWELRRRPPGGAGDASWRALDPPNR